MMIRLAILLLALVAQSDMTPLGAVREVVQYAIELPDGRVCVLSSQRLALLSRPDAQQVTSSAWLPNSAQRGFTIHGGYAYVPHRLGIAIVRIHPDRLEHVRDIELKYASRRQPRVVDGKLLVLRGRTLMVYGLEDPADPRPLHEVELPAYCGDLTVGESEVIVCSKNHLHLYDRKTLAHRRDLESPAEVIGAMCIRGDSLFIFADRKLYQADTQELKFRIALEKASPVALIVDRPGGLAAFRGYTRLHLRLEGDALALEDKVDDWPLESATPTTTGEALGASELWTRLPTLSACAYGEHLVLFDAEHAHVYNIAEFANPRFVGRVEFRAVSAQPTAHGDRIYARNGVLDLNDPGAPRRLKTLYGIASVVDGDTLYVRRGPGLAVYTITDLGVSESGVIAIRPPPSVFAIHNGILFYVDQRGILRSSQIDGEELKPLGELELERRARASALSVHDDILYMSSYDGLRAVDIADPTAMKVLAHLRNTSRHYGIAGRDRFAFSMRSGTGVVAMDLEQEAMVERGPVTNSRFLQIHRVHVFAGLPVGGVGIYRSEVLDQVAEEARIRAAETDPLALAKLAAEQGSWQAGRLFATLPPTPNNQAAITAYKEEREARRRGKAAGEAFREAHKRQRFAYFRPDDDGQIRTIRVNKPALLREHVDYLRTLPLEKLDYFSGPLGAEDLAFIGQLTSLRELRLRELEAPAEAFAPLAALSELRYIDFNDSDLPPGALTHLAGLKTLDWLDLDSCAIRDADVAALAGLTELSYLSLQDCPITEASLVHLRGLGKLRVLDLGGTRLRGFAELAMLTKVEILDLQAIPATEGFEALGGMTGLKKVDLDRTPIDDTQLVALGALVQLKTLSLAGTRITDAGLPHLGKLPALANLVLNGNDVTDEGLEALTDLPLERLFLRDTAATETAKRLFPGAQVQVRPAAPPPTKIEREEEARLQRMPKNLAFSIVDNKLVLSDADGGAEFARATPADLFGDESVVLQGLVAWEGECWVGSDRGLLRFEPRARVWSRFAVDREHLEVPIRSMEQRGDLLVVRYGEDQEARFHLHDRRWLVAAVAEVAVVPVAAPVEKPESVPQFGILALGALILGFISVLLYRRQSPNKSE